jgi:hypothetical protein
LAIRRRFCSSFGVGILCSAIAGTSLEAQPMVGQPGKANSVPVCPGPAAQGAARCSSHIVTDKAGNIIVNPPPPPLGNKDGNKDKGERPSGK